MKFKLHKKTFRFASLPDCYIAVTQDEGGDVEISYNDDYTLGVFYLGSENDREEIKRFGFPVEPPADDSIDEECGEIVDELERLRNELSERGIDMDARGGKWQWVPE